MIMNQGAAGEKPAVIAKAFIMVSRHVVKYLQLI